jgi:CRP-like cAMP-binding protein
VDPKKPRNCTSCPTRVDSVFCDLPIQHLSELNKHKTTNRYKRGQALYFEGNPANGIFCLGKGKVKLTKGGSDGKEVIVKIAKPGDVLGYWNVVVGKDYSSTAEVIEDSEVCFVDKLFVQYIISSDPTVAFQVISRLGEDLAFAEKRLSDMLNKDVRQRLLRLLLVLQKAHGRKTEKGISLDIKLTRNDLGSMMGATPETVIRLLSDLKDEGSILLDKKNITIRDLKSLAQEAEVEL